MWERLRRLCVRRERGGQGELKGCATGGVSVGPQAATMRLNDRPTDGQPHTRPVILGRKECPEDLVRLLRGQSHTGIADRDQQLTIADFRLDGKLTSATRFLHGVDAVEHEVHENLLQLHTVCHHLGKVLGKLGADGDRVDRKSTRLNSSHSQISYAVFCLKKKKMTILSVITAYLILFVVLLLERSKDFMK